MLDLIRSFASDDRGTETVEYAVITAFIVAALVATIMALSGAIQGRFGQGIGVDGGIN